MSKVPLRNVTVIQHALASHSLSVLRNAETPTAIFRWHSDQIAGLLIAEATRELPTREYEVTTPLTTTRGAKLARPLVAIPVLRSGIALVGAIQRMLPDTVVGFIGLERDEETAKAHLYYHKIPADLSNCPVLVLDPMLATGGSMSDTLSHVRSQGASDITAICVVAAPEGIRRINEEHPDVRIFTAAVDSHLDDNWYIVPGLGDYGDRYFNTL